MKSEERVVEGMNDRIPSKFVPVTTVNTGAPVFTVVAGHFTTLRAGFNSTIYSSYARNCLERKTLKNYYKGINPHAVVFACVCVC